MTLKTRAAGGAAEIAVIDRGSGIEKGLLEAVFNPFFTTKPEGVGLGLAIVSKIVDEHGGKIAVESEAGKRKRLPGLSAPYPTARSPLRKTVIELVGPFRMKNRILVVEDEEKLRRVIELQLATRPALTWTRPATAEDAHQIGGSRRSCTDRPANSPTWMASPSSVCIRRQNAQVPVVIMMTAYGSVETAVEAMKAGAADFCY